VGFYLKVNKKGLSAQVVENLPSELKALSSNPNCGKKKKKPYINNKNIAGDVTSVVEHLPSKCNALSINPSTTHQKSIKHPVF
jgi:hypothetical protein